MKIFKYMGNKVPVQKINFEDMQSYIKSNSTIIISTLPINNQYSIKTKDICYQLY